MTFPAVGHGHPTTLELFTPKLVTVFREGYGLADLRADAVAGLTVAIVALPLSIAIAIASGVGPERGVYTAIVGGFIVSLLGGSRVQIGGPAGAFIVLVAAVVQRHGYDGLALATLIAGLILVAVGFLLHQVHPLSRDGRIHGRHRRNHSGEPGQGAVRS
jgi:SulP family sulfate permease